MSLIDLDMIQNSPSLSRKAEQRQYQRYLLSLRLRENRRDRIRRLAGSLATRAGHLAARAGRALVVWGNRIDAERGYIHG